MVRRLEGRKEAVAAMVSSGKVTRVGGWASGHDFPIREHLEEEEDEENSFPASAWPGSDPSGMLHGPRPWRSLELAENDTRDLETAQGNYGDKEGEKAMLTTAKTETMAAQFAGRRAAGHGNLLRLRAETGVRGNEMVEGESGSSARATQMGEERGKENVGAGEETCGRRSLQQRKGIGRGRLEGMKLTSRAHLSAREREREGEGEGKDGRMGLGPR